MKLTFLLIAPMLTFVAHAGAVFTSANASTAAGLQPAIDAFRASIGGGTVSGANGSFGGVRREVNWDGVPDNFADTSLMPATFFVNNSPRGLGMSGPVNGFMVSANPGQPTAALFESFDGAAQGNNTYDFHAFSQSRVFSAIGGTDYDFSMFIPGNGFANPTFTLAFGLIFVDNTNSTFPLCASMTAFNGATSLGFRCANSTTAGGFSFLGVTATGADVITKVTIHQGNAQLGTAQDSTHDVVVIDDLIYAEPGLASLPGTTTPEPTTMLLTAAGIFALGLIGRTRSSSPIA